MARKRRHARERRELAEEIACWRTWQSVRPDGPAAEVAAWREIVDATHREVHELLGELCDIEREDVWPPMTKAERDLFDREHKDWLRSELRRIDERLAFLKQTREELAGGPEPPEIAAQLARASQDWCDFVVNCSREEEHALGLDVRLDEGMKRVGF